MHSIQERLVSLTVSHFPGTMSNRCPACDIELRRTFFVFRFFVFSDVVNHDSA